MLAGNKPVLVHNCREYFNSYQSGGRGGVFASIDDGGVLNTYVEVMPGTPNGGRMFTDAMDAIGHRAAAVRGNWHSGGTLRDNLDSFNAGIQNGLAPEEAAMHTFTGKMASRYGFSRAWVESTRGPMGEYSDATVIFYR
ncbi:hypothetical protein [Micromonospora tulbaghiae]